MAHARGRTRGWSRRLRRGYTSGVFTSSTLCCSVFTYPAFRSRCLPIGPLFGFGPLEVRWYGIMYLVGFALGWLGCARAAQAAVEQDQRRARRRRRLLRGARRDHRRPHRLHAVLRLQRADRAIRSAIFKVWQGGMSFHGGLVGVLIAMWLFGRRASAAVLRRHGFRRAVVGVRPVRGPHRQLHQRRALGQADEPRRAVGRASSTARRGTRASSTRRSSKAWCCSWCSGCTRASRGRAMARVGAVPVVYGVFRFPWSSCACRTSNRGYLAFGWVTMGQVLSLPMIVGGICAAVRARRTPPAASRIRQATAADMRQYLDLLRHVREHGARKDDRTGTGTLSRVRLSDALRSGRRVSRCVTTKKLHLRSIVHELLWFLKGDTNVALPARQRRHDLGRVGRRERRARARSTARSGAPGATADGRHDRPDLSARST